MTVIYSQQVLQVLEVLQSAFPAKIKIQSKEYAGEQKGKRKHTHIYI